MQSRRKNPFRPSVESTEARLLATVGLGVAAGHGAEIHASSASEGQAWVEIVNRTGKTLELHLSADEGSKYYDYQLRGHSTGFYHVNHDDQAFLIKVDHGSPTDLDTGPSRQDAAAYSIDNSLAVTPKAALNGGPKLRVNTVRFSILNQSGLQVPIYFSVDGGKTYPTDGPSDVIPIGNGLVPRTETLEYTGDRNIYYKFTGDTGVRGTRLTTFGQYYLFRTTGYQPYLSPTS